LCARVTFTLRHMRATSYSHVWLLQSKHVAAWDFLWQKSCIDGWRQYYCVCTNTMGMSYLRTVG